MLARAVGRGGVGAVRWARRGPLRRSGVVDAAASAFGRGGAWARRRGHGGVGAGATPAITGRLARGLSRRAAVTGSRARGFARLVSRTVCGGARAGRHVRVSAGGTGVAAKDLGSVSVEESFSSPVEVGPPERCLSLSAGEGDVDACRSCTVASPKLRHRRSNRKRNSCLDEIAEVPSEP